MNVTVTLPFVALCTAFVIIDGSLLPLAVLVFALAHEAGHLIAMKLCGYKLNGMKISAVGAAIRCDDKHHSYLCDIIAALSGPFVNFLLFFVFLKLTGIGWFKNNGVFFLTVNFLLFSVNMLPVSCLDGGRALSAFLSYFLLPDKRDVVMRALSVIFCTLLIILGAYLLYVTHFNFSLLIIGIYLTFMLLKVNAK